MQLVESECTKRNCLHYRGEVDIHTCLAFPNGIPDSIAYGKNKHLKPVAGDHGFQFLKGKK